MEENKINYDDISKALINMCESTDICDNETAKGMTSSKKKDILKSNKENSFSKFTGEIKKRQINKEN